MKRIVVCLASLALIGTACKVHVGVGDANLIPQPAEMTAIGTGTVKVTADKVTTWVDTTLVFGHGVRGEGPDPEGYVLTVKDGRIEIRGGGDAGVFYGLQTLEQLKDADGYVPEVEIKDAPRFTWRGMHLDVARHFQPVEFIKRYLDMLAYHKINTFHWHLTDGIGWRIRIDRYPLLTERGAWRTAVDPQTPWLGWKLATEDTPGVHGGYYTKDQIRDVVAYAASKHITVIPEIEMPGHSEAATYCYPEHICVQARPGSGIYCPGKESTFEFLQHIIDEVIELFPSEFIHIGGDEVGKEQWQACPLCQKRKREEGLKDEHELQSYFVQRMERYIASKGKRMVGWDEILEGGLAKGATVMSWTGFEGAVKAANAGHDAVLAPLNYVYFDHYQGRHPDEPQAWGGYNGIPRVYSFDPMAEGVLPGNEKHILGGQANLWTESISKADHIEYMLLPRLAALSEALWTPREEKNWERFERKLDRQYDRYAEKGWNYAESAFTPGVTYQYFTPAGSLVMQLACELDGYPIHYTLDGSEPTLQSPLYADSLVVDHPAELKARTFRNGKPVGYLRQVPRLLNLATQARVIYATPYNPAYSGGGDGALTDNRYANKQGDDPAWQGFEQQDMELTVDLGTVTEGVGGVVLRFFQHVGSTSVMLPASVVVSVSSDGEAFTAAAKYLVPPSTNTSAFIETIDLPFSAGKQAVRYIRVWAENSGPLPDWHFRAGVPSWIFMDEIAAY